MVEYDLMSSEEAGRLAKMISEVTGGELNFVFTYIVPTEDGCATGAVSNIDPEHAIKVLLGAVEALQQEGEYKDVTLREN